MVFELIFAAPLAVQIHLGAAVLAVIIGPFALYRLRRARVHRIPGRVWVATMAVLALSGLFIPAVILPLVGSFGPVHLLSVCVLISLAIGLSAILRRDVGRHRATMGALYRQALGIAGVLTLLPGRRLNAALFGEAEVLSLWVIAGVGCGAGVSRVWATRDGSDAMRTRLGRNS